LAIFLASETELPSLTSQLADFRSTAILNKLIRLLLFFLVLAGTTAYNYTALPWYTNCLLDLDAVSYFDSIWGLVKSSLK